MTNPNDRTGRTTRMLADAAAHASGGRYVFVIGANLQHANSLLISFRQKYHCESLGDGKVSCGLGSVQFCPSRLLDWEYLRMPRAHSDCVTLVDHYAIECRYPRALEMLHRYDPAEPLPGEDIVDLLEARGDELSKRAARYIRIKRSGEESRERQSRELHERLLREERDGR